MPPISRRADAPTRVAPDDILVATETFSTEHDGSPVTIHKGEDRVRAGHSLAQRFPQFFKPAGSLLRFEGGETATQAQNDQRGNQD